MEWIDVRISELKATESNLLKDYVDSHSDDEKGNLALMLVHLSMHIADLQRVKQYEIDFAR